MGKKGVFGKDAIAGSEGAAATQTRGAAATQTRGAAATQTRGAVATQTRGAAATQTRGVAATQTQGAAASLIFGCGDWQVIQKVRPVYNQSGGVCFSETYEEVDVVGQRKPLAYTPVTFLGQVSP